MTMNSKTILKELIENFELGRIGLEETLNSVYSLTKKNIDEYELRNYWTSASLDEFCEKLLTNPIKNWKDVDDIEAEKLIKEILENITNDGLLERNSEALEKRYNKVNGFISNLIFYSGLNDEKDILTELKKDKTIYL